MSLVMLLLGEWGMVKVGGEGSGWGGVGVSGGGDTGCGGAAMGDDVPSWLIFFCFYFFLMRSQAGWLAVRY